MNDDLLKKTLKTMGVMLGALTVFMGTLTIIVLVVCLIVAAFVYAVDAAVSNLLRLFL